MSQDRDTATSLESWLEKTYARFLRALQGLACETTSEGKKTGERNISLSPYFPVEVDASFLESALKAHALDLTGALYRVLEMIVDVPGRKVLLANVIVPCQVSPVQVVPVDPTSIQATIAAAIGQKSTIASLDGGDLDKMLEAARNAKPVGSATIPPVDIIRIIDGKLHERLRANEGLDNANSGLDPLARAIGTLLGGCRDGLVRTHPPKDKLANFACKIGSALHGNVLEDIADIAPSFFPVGSAAIMIHAGDAITAFRATRPKHGPITITELAIPDIKSTLPVVPDVLDSLTAKVHHTSRVDVVLVFSLAGLVEPLTMLVDGVSGGLHEVNGPGLVRSVLESLGLFARTFKKTWYSRPRAMVTKLFPRFLLRFARIRLDLPRFLHDRAAAALVSTAITGFGMSFSIAIVSPGQHAGTPVIRAIDVTVRNLVPVRIASLDPAAFAGLDWRGIDASSLARSIHSNLTATAPGESARFVLVVGPKLAAAVASALRAMFKRVAWNPFALLDMLKRIRDPRSFGLHPMPQVIGDLLASKHKDIARQLSRSLVLKY